jgi:hypothetical protein
MMQEVTKENALAVAQVFLNAPHVQGVDVIGSVARNKRGNDLDLVIVVDPVTYTSYVLALREQYPYGDDFYSSFKEDRLRAALLTLKFTTPFTGWLNLATKGFCLDIHLMPQGWKGEAEAIQGHLSHDDPNFVSNIAKDAVSLNPQWREALGDEAVVEALWR